MLLLSPYSDAVSPPSPVMLKLGNVARVPVWPRLMVITAIALLVCLMAGSLSALRLWAALRLEKLSRRGQAFAVFNGVAAVACLADALRLGYWIARSLINSN